jgi:two-component system, NtrC family, nitrogen regulation response regulator NtrX
VPETRIWVALVVDDEPAIRELAAAVLQVRGYLTLSACAAAEALELSRGCGERIDVLITDVELGDGDGIDLAEVIRVDRPDIAVLVISGNGTYQTRAVAKRYAFLPKPFRAAQLLELVHSLLTPQ